MADKNSPLQRHLPSFQTLMARWSWREIANCPGRYVLQCETRVDFVDLLGTSIPPAQHHSPRARDVVLVARIEGGGVISYQRHDASLLHTLNNDLGFLRKLSQLGIALDSSD